MKYRRKIAAYLRAWRAYDAGLARPPHDVTGLSPRRAKRLARAYYLGANVVKASEDKQFPGASGRPPGQASRVRGQQKTSTRIPAPSRPPLRVQGTSQIYYASSMSPPATLLMWFQLRSPELAEDFERLMTEDRDIVRGSLDTVSDWRLTRPADVPGQAIGQADYVLIAEIVEVERFEQQASEHVQRLADDLAHLVSSRGMLIVLPVLS